MRWTIIALAALLIILQYNLWFAPGGIATTFHLIHGLSLQRKANEDLQKRNAILIATIDAFKNDSDTIEATAREELNMVKPGETYYQVIKNHN